MIDVYHVINNIRRIIGLHRPPIVTSAGVKMRNPYNEKGEWIGWTDEEVATHFSSIEKYKSIIPHKEPLKENKNGCGRG
jgi:hypothetical protein